MAICSLRQQIQEVIEKSKSPEKAALKICAILEDNIGLAGNGWFDDDKEVDKAIQDFYKKKREKK